MTAKAKNKFRNYFTFSLNLTQFILIGLLLFAIFVSIETQVKLNIFKFNMNFVKTYFLVILGCVLLIFNVTINKRYTFAISALISLAIAALLLNFSEVTMFHGISFAILGTINAITNFVFI